VPVRVAQVTTLAPVAHVRGAQVQAQPGADRRATSLRLYTVRPGDTLYAIAQRHHAAVDALASLNGLTAQSRLQPGQKLRLP
jgi:LysM repeat protein